MIIKIRLRLFLTLFLNCFSILLQTICGLHQNTSLMMLILGHNQVMSLAMVSYYLNWFVVDYRTACMKTSIKKVSDKHYGKKEVNILALHNFLITSNKNRISVLIFFSFFILKVVVERVKKGQDPPFRPRITADLVESPIYIKMAKSCWSENPLDRPKFSDCLKNLRQMNKGK